MQEVLKLLAKNFKTHEIRWGVGGSMLLKKHSLVKSVNDIDLIVSELDIHKAVEILDQLGSKAIPPKKDEYVTKYFYQYHIHGISIDVISRFTIKHDMGSYEMIFDDMSVVDYQLLDDARIPYTSLEDWLIAYMLMRNRDSKVELIWEYLMQEGVFYPELIERALKQQLPQGIEMRLRELILGECTNDN